jgi:hypothetical protein
VFVTVKQASRNSTAGHHAAATASPRAFPCCTRATKPRHPGSPGVMTLTCTDEIFGKGNALSAAMPAVAGV